MDEKIITELYIPHGSDESFLGTIDDCVLTYTLYPTWFR